MFVTEGGCDMTLYLLCQHETGRELVIPFEEGVIPFVPRRYDVYGVLTKRPEYDEFGNVVFPGKSCLTSGNAPIIGSQKGG